MGLSQKMLEDFGHRMMAIQNQHITMKFSMLCMDITGENITEKLTEFIHFLQEEQAKLEAEYTPLTTSIEGEING